MSVFCIRGAWKTSQYNQNSTRKIKHRFGDRGHSTNNVRLKTKISKTGG